MNDDLISKKTAIKAILKVPDGNWSQKRYAQEIRKLPPVDAVPVVRCKDCNEYQDNFHWCKLHDVEMQPMDFCSYGERKDAAD